MKRFGLMFGLFFVMGLVALWGGLGNTAVATNTAVQEEACLPNDPYDLDGLMALLDSDTPSTVPIQLNDFITVEYLGEATFVEEEPDTDLYTFDDAVNDPREDPEEPGIDEIRVGTVEMISVDTHSNHMYKISVVEEALRDIHDCREEAGMTTGSHTVDNPQTTEQGFQLFLPAIVGSSGGTIQIDPRGRPKGVENRVRFNPTLKYPWRTIAAMGGVENSAGNPVAASCTGTMIGPRLMVTAAHCISDFGTDKFKGATVNPARKGIETPYGSVSVSSTVSRWRYFLLPDWVNGNGAEKESDWALVVLPANPFPTLNQWMGYASLSGNSLANYNVYNRGYPTCNQPNPTHPVPCDFGQMYGDKGTCALGEYHSLDASGWNRNIRHDCATSAGQSGSALYLYLGNSPAVIGTHIGTGLCDFDANKDKAISADEECTEDDPQLVNVFRRHTPNEIWLISFYRELFQ